MDISQSEPIQLETEEEMSAPPHEDNISSPDDKIRELEYCRRFYAAKFQI